MLHGAQNFQDQNQNNNNKDNKDNQMKITLSTSQVADRLLNDDNANWSWEGAQALAEFLEDQENDLGEELEFDVVAIRCDFHEYDDTTEALKAHVYKDDVDEMVRQLTEEEATDEEWHQAAIELLEEHVRIIIQLPNSGGIITSNS